MAENSKLETLSMQAGGFLKRELKRRGITQFDFSYIVGVDVRTVGRWVSGDIHRLESIEDICTALNVSVRDIFDDAKMSL